MPLVIAPTDVKLRVVKLIVDDRTRKHLENLGIVCNSTLEVLSNSGGSVICVIKQGRLAIDRTIATKILVAQM